MGAVVYKDPVGAHHVVGPTCKIHNIHVLFLVFIVSFPQVLRIRPCYDGGNGHRPGTQLPVLTAAPGALQLQLEFLKPFTKGLRARV